MSAGPLLRHLVERTGAGEGYLLVLDGEGLADLPPTLSVTHHTWTVARATTELGLRRLLWRAGEAPLIAVVPPKLAHRLPADLVLGATNQRVQALETGEVLSVLLGRKVLTSSQEWFNRLVIANVDPIVTALNQRTLPTVVNRAELAELVAEVVLSQEIRTAQPGHLCARWLVTPPQVEPDTLRLLQEEALPRLHGDEGALLAWGLEAPAQLERLVVVGLALTVTDDGEHVPDGIWRDLLRAPLFKEPFQGDKGWLHAALTRLARATATALESDATPWLLEAEKLARDAFPKSQIATSQVLPHSFDLQAHALVQRAARGEPLFASDLASVESHQVAASRGGELRLLRCVARLSRYLSLPDADCSTTAEWVAAYTHTHAYADMAAVRLQRWLGNVASADLHEPAQRILRAWEDRRNGLNERFAHFLAGDWEARLHDGVTPVHRIARNVLQPVVSQGNAVFLVVLDGCSVPVFHELVLDLSRKHGVGLDAAGPRAGLALLPSITSHSRGAIFLGEIPRDPFLAETRFHEDERVTDPARFKQNPHLARAERTLLLKGDLVRPGPLMDALGSEIPVVAAVFNAVDDQISGHNTGAVMRISVDDIRFLVVSVKRALERGRKVLVTADHGHTRWLRKDGHVGKGAASRWLELGPKTAVPDGFLAIDTGSTAGTPGPKAFAWRMNTWLGSPHLGYHGGCSLEELVVPLVWLESGGTPMLEPGWWHDLPHTAASEPSPDEVPTVIEAAPPPPPVRPPAPQLGLLDPRDQLEKHTSRAGVLGLPADVLATLDPEQIAVLVLLKENERMTTEEVQQMLSKPIGRINGFMGTLRRALHRRGHALYAIDDGANGMKTFRWTGEA